MNTDCLNPQVIELLVAGQLCEADVLHAERHLDLCTACMDLLGTLAASRTANESTSATASGADRVRTGDVMAGPLSPGTMLGRYEVRRWLGRGGMGDVYEGFDRHLERRVALKVLRDAAGDADLARLRLGREAKSLARLSHPNVVAVYDVALDGDRLFLVMELVEGLTLAAWLKAEPRTWRQILDVFLDAGEGLAAAHAVGVIHRDFKPQNVLIGADGRARVGDFGLARTDPHDRGGSNAREAHAESARPDCESLTTAGTLVGTPRYMAPEQKLGHAVDARADQFSFAVALWEALYAAHPFSEPRGGGVGVPASPPLTRTGVNRPFDPPRGSRVPGAYAAVLGRSLGSSPAARYGAMRDLLSALRRTQRVGRRRIATLVGTAALLLAGTGLWSAGRKPGFEILGPAGEAADWSASKVIFEVKDRVYCTDRLDDNTIRVVWGTPRRAEDVDIRTGSRRTANLVPESYRYSCPQTSPDGRKLLYEGFDDNHRPQVFLSPSPTGLAPEPLVSCAAPSHHSEPLWLASGEEFVFDSDFMHPAIFSLRSGTVRIIPDQERPKESGNGFFKAVSRSGDRIAVVHDLGAYSSVHIYRWPNLEMQASFRYSVTVGWLWNFGTRADTLFTWDTEDESLVRLRTNVPDLTRVGRIPGYQMVGLWEFPSEPGVILSRRAGSFVKFSDPQGTVRQIPTNDANTFDSSPSMLPSGDVLFLRRIGGGSRIRLYSPVTGRDEPVSEGPWDLAPSALPNGDFLAFAPPAGDKQPLTAVRCPSGFRGSTTKCTKVAELPLAVVLGPASPDGEWIAFVTSSASGAVLRVLSLQQPADITELAENASTCQLIWSGRRTLWASLRFDHAYRWTELDVVTGKSTGRSVPGTGCPTGDPDPDPPGQPGAWTVMSHEYQLRRQPL